MVHVQTGLTIGRYLIILSKYINKYYANRIGTAQRTAGLNHYEVLNPEFELIVAMIYILGFCSQTYHLALLPFLGIIPLKYIKKYYIKNILPVIWFP